MSERRFARFGTALAMVLALSGCVAAAIPVLAGGLIARKETGEDKPATTPSHAPVKPIVEVLDSDYSLPPTGEPAQVPPGLIAVALVPPAPEPIPTPAAELMPTAQPAIVARSSISAPSAATTSSATPYAAFARFAIAHAPPLPAGKVRRSALVDQDSITSEPRLADCGDGPPAVAIDLDKGGTPFDLTDPPFPANGLAEQLTAIRSAGVTVLWSASLRVDAAPRLYTVLRASGLDPDRTDRLLLLRGGEERKQERRFAASRDWCILAVAGDTRGDFDELYDYLRDPAGPLAAALEPTFGEGWFLVPPPID
ncbi:MAG TPA: hypothetical protein VHG29_13225 [Novosphingobium sp.]|nr:hypothetical protein [Novosphingobium sp.]